MKHLFFLFFIVSSAVFGQDLKLSKATMQTVNHGASPTSTTTYTILLQKSKKCLWSIDSVVSTSSNQSIKYNLVKVDNTNATSPDYKKVEGFSKADRGTYQITFGITKQRGSGRPGAPQNQKADTTTIEGGVTIYYSIKKKRKQLKVVEFEQLETVDAP